MFGGGELRRVALCVLLVMMGCAKKEEPKPVEAKPYTCVAGVNEMCPPEDWAADYRAFKAENEKYKVPQKELDYINGLAARLRTAIPNGYQVDEKTGKWVKTPTPVDAGPKK